MARLSVEAPPRTSIALNVALRRPLSVVFALAALALGCATSDADCRASASCINNGECSANGGKCEPATRRDVIGELSSF